MAAHQAPPSLGFSRQEHWSGLPFPSPMHEREKWKWSRSVMSYSLWPHGLQPTRLLHPWDFPGKSTGVGCHCLLHWHLVKSSRSCPILCNSMDCNPRGSSVHGLLQARILERVAYPFSRGSFRPRNRTGVSCIAGGFLTSWAIRSDQSLSRVRLFATPWIAARQVSLSITNSRSSLRLTSIESVIPSSHLILCRPLLLLEKPPNFWGGPTITCIIYMCLSLSGPSFDDDISLLWLADLVWQQQRDSADVIKIPNKLIWG